MRFNQLFAFTAIAGTALTTAHAQDTRASTEARIRTESPFMYRYSSDEPSSRAALGIGTRTTGTLRDTLGLLITSITRGSPAEKAGLEEGNRLAAINTVNLRANAADIEDSDMSSAITRRLTRELAKSKPGDEVQLSVYRDGRTQAMKIRTADADSLFRRVGTTTYTRVDAEDRPTLGISVGSTGSRRDTLGVLVMGVADSSAAARAGIEEGNRIAAINGVNLRVSRDDAGDRWLSSAKAQRLQREVAQMKAGENVTLRVYSDGQFRDVSMKVGRAGDLPKGSRGMFYMGGDGFGTGAMMATPRMPAMPFMPPMAPMGREYMEYGPEVERALENARVQLQRIEPMVRMRLDEARPQLERLRMELPRALEPIRARIRTVTVIV